MLTSQDAVRRAAYQDALRLLIPEVLEDGKVVAIATDGLSPERNNILMVATIPIFPYGSVETRTWMIDGGNPELTEQYTGISPTLYNQTAKPREEVLEEVCGELGGVIAGYMARRFLSGFLSRICMNHRKDCLVDLSALISGRECLEALASAARAGMTLTKWYDLLVKAGGWKGSMEAAFGLFPDLEMEKPAMGEPVVLSTARNTKRLLARLVFGDVDNHLAVPPGE